MTSVTKMQQHSPVELPRLPNVKYGQIVEELRAHTENLYKRAKAALTRMVAFVSVDQNLPPEQVKLSDIATNRVADAMEMYGQHELGDTFLQSCRCVYRALGYPSLMLPKSRMYQEYHPALTEWIEGLDIPKPRQIGYRSTCMRFLTWLTEDTLIRCQPHTFPLPYIQRRHLLDYRRHLLRTVKHGERSAATAKWHLQIAVRWMTWLMSTRKIGEFDLTDVTIRASESRLKRVPTHPEISGFMEELMNSDVDDTYVIFFLLIAATGARPIELQQLTLADVDAVRHSIRLQSKNGPERWLPLQDNLWEILSRHIDQNHTNADLLTPVLQGQTGEQLHASVIQEHYMNAKQRSQIDIDGPMIFRHRLATDCYEAKMSPSVFQYVMGHKTLAEMKRYQHSNPYFEQNEVTTALDEWMERLQ